MGELRADASETVRGSGQNALSPWKALLSQCFEILGVCAFSSPYMVVQPVRPRLGAGRLRRQCSSY